MPAVAASYRPPPKGLRRPHARLAFGAGAILLAATGFLTGGLGGTPSAADPVAFVGGVPVGVERSPGGALAAADNYLAFEQQTVERDPARFAELVRVGYSLGIRRTSLAAAVSDRKADPDYRALWARGGRSFTVIGARRLDGYRGTTATVTTWAGEVYWGSRGQPAQVWRLVETTLRWSRDRWLVAGMRTLPAAAPEPSATPQATSGDDTTHAFESSLVGFNSVDYGAPAR